MKKLAFAKNIIIVCVSVALLPTSCQVMPEIGIKDIAGIKTWIIEQGDTVVESTQELQNWLQSATEISLPELKDSIEHFIAPNAFSIPYPHDENEFSKLVQNEFLSPSDLTASDIKRAEEMVEKEINQFNWGEPIGVADITLPGTAIRLYRLVSDNTDIEIDLAKYFDFEKEISPLELTSGSLIARTFNQIKGFTEKVNAENQE